MIYAVQGEDGGLVKIGYALSSPEDRFSSLQTGSPVRLVLRAVIAGERAEESALHVRFAADRVHGEWFRPSVELERVFGVDLRVPPSPSGLRLALTKSEAAAALGVSVDFLEDHVWSELMLVRRGRKTLVSVRELEAWLARSAMPTIARRAAA